mmetsp:Transcript_28650/g.77582  ORF Transcript_28650/g.77582 Transcript_28650/m.77582 type:complete len:212 (-) Transcript_28650:4075-4710(-)
MIKMNPSLVIGSVQAAILAGFALLTFESNVVAFSNTAIIARRKRTCGNCLTIEPPGSYGSSVTLLKSSAESTAATATADDGENKKEEEVVDYEVPEDAVIVIKPKAMKRLRELREKQPNPDAFMVLRMGVRNGGCSGLSYVMDFSTEEDIQEDDEVDEYPAEMLKCVVDAKSMLYLYGLELDYSEELIGGGFKFFNPNAEESCGCGSSFGV